MNSMKDSVILITGGTGTFGSAFLERCLQQGASEIRVFSRDEKKQHEMAQRFIDYPQVKFFAGDVRDRSDLNKVMHNVDFVFHAAAMKQIPNCEQYPEEAIKTNIIGSENVLETALVNKIKKIIFLSTDKSVYPSSMMGITKACMEKIALSAAKRQNSTSICVTRFCNLIASNGSVVPLFIDQTLAGKPITITDPNMTRFMISIKEAVDLVEYAFLYGENGDILIRPGKLCKLDDLSKAIHNLYGKNKGQNIKIIGARPGERVEEALFTSEEWSRAKMEKDFIRIPLFLEKKNNQDFYTAIASIDDIEKMIIENFNKII